MYAYFILCLNNLPPEGLKVISIAPLVTDGFKHAFNHASNN